MTTRHLVKFIKIFDRLKLTQVVYESGTTRWITDGLKTFGHSLERHVIGGASVQVQWYPFISIR